MLRIVAGEYGGRYIKSPGGAGTRPTAQPVREALFGALGRGVENAVFADLFAGSGAVGIEALSRGASAALFAEQDRVCMRIIRENLAGIGADARRGLAAAIDLSRAAAPAALAGCLKKIGAAADIVFADPPYRFAGLPEALAGFAVPGIIKGGGTLVVESHKKTAPPADIGPMSKYSEKIYGDTMLSFYK